MPQSKNPPKRDPLDHFDAHCAAVKLLALLILRGPYIVAAYGAIAYGPAALRTLQLLP